MRRLTLLGSILLVVVGAFPAGAQDYPSRPIKLVVPWAAGGGIDNLARVVGEKLEQSLAQPVVIENRPGAGSGVGTAFVAKAPADGYTLILSNTTHAINATLYRTLAYDSVRDFAPVVFMASSMGVLVVNPAFQAKTVQDLVAMAKAKPGTIDYGSAGNGSIQHLAAELLKSMAKINLVHIPYKAGATVVTDLLSQRVSVYIPPIAQIMPMIGSGKLRPIAVTGKQRSSLMPDVPTVSESGVPGFDVIDWYGIQAPAGTSAEIVDKLNGAVNRILATAEMRERLRPRGYEIAGGTPAEFSALIQADIERWAGIIKASGARLD